MGSLVDMNSTIYLSCSTLHIEVKIKKYLYRDILKVVKLIFILNCSYVNCVLSWVRISFGLLSLLQEVSDELLTSMHTSYEGPEEELETFCPQHV